MAELTVFILHVLFLREVGISKHLVKIIKLFINERYNGYHLNLLTEILLSYCGKMDVANEIPKSISR